MSAPHALVRIPLPRADHLVRPRLARRWPEYVPVDGSPAAHVPLLGPLPGLESIEPGVLTEMRRFFGDVIPFGFELTEVCAFPDGSAYLSPVPAAPLRRLAHALHRLLPEYPAHAGAFDEVVPHVSVPLPEGTDLGGLEAELTDQLPLQVWADEAALSWCAAGASRTLATFGFGTSAA